MTTTPANADKAFTGAIPRLYETHLVPLIFAPYATDLANRLLARPLRRVLEIAAGTGVVTRALAATLADDVAIVASDLNQEMLDHATALGTPRPVEWRRADAMELPFAEATFDAVICQFGWMFFPDKAKAFAEARRVLAPGGVLVFSVWDRIEDNEFADVVTDALASLFPQDPPRFLARTPHGYHDFRVVQRDLADGGFARSARVDTLAERSRAASANVPAIAYCQGTPLRNEIEARKTRSLADATDAAAQAIARRFGATDVDGKIQAHIITIER